MTKPSRLIPRDTLVRRDVAWPWTSSASPASNMHFYDNTARLVLKIALVGLTFFLIIPRLLLLPEAKSVFCGFVNMSIFVHPRTPGGAAVRYVSTNLHLHGQLATALACEDVFVWIKPIAMFCYVVQLDVLFLHN